MALAIAVALIAAGSGTGAASAVDLPGGPEIPVDVPIYIPELGNLPLGPTPLSAKGAHRPVPPPTGCAKTVKPEEADQAVNAARAGDRICVIGGSAQRMLIIRAAGNPQPNITLTGDGSPIKGIFVVADNVVIENFNSVDAEAPGVLIKGSNMTLRNVVIDNPKDGDNDGIRFFGSRLRIFNNTITNARNTNHAHADCMQTYSKDGDPRPPVVIGNDPSWDVIIDSNRCEGIDNQCLIAEGPNDGEGSGQGYSHDIVFSRNLCDATGLAYQAVMLEDIQRTTIAFNDIKGPIRKAFAFDIGSTEGKVVGNRLDPRIPCQVGMDEFSRPGYLGPAPTCEP